MPPAQPDAQPAAQPSAGFTSYETIGERYGQVVDTRPYNAYYERPAMLSLLPPLYCRPIPSPG